jgi:hypothetical protein
MPLFIMFVIIVALFLLLPLDIPRSVRVSSPPFPFIHNDNKHDKKRHLCLPIQRHESVQWRQQKEIEKKFFHLTYPGACASQVLHFPFIVRIPLFIEPAWLVAMSSGRSRNRATMITNMIKSGIFVSPYRDTSQSNGFFHLTYPGACASQVLHFPLLSAYPFLSSPRGW